MINKISENFSQFHPLVIFIYFFLLFVSVIFTMNPFFLGITILSSSLFIILNNGVKEAFKTFKYVFLLIIIVTIINPIFSHDGLTIFFYVNGNAITLEAIIYGFALGIFISGTFLWCKCMWLIIDEEQILYLLGRIIPSTALTISIIFRFIPLLKERFEKISICQKSIEPSIHNHISKIKLQLKEISILITWSLESSIDTADSMEARGYGLRGRSSFHLYKFTKRDGLLTAVIVFLSSLILHGVFSKCIAVYYYPSFIFWKINSFTYICIFSYFFFTFLPVITSCILERNKLKCLNKINDFSKEGSEELG